MLLRKIPQKSKKNKKKIKKIWSIQKLYISLWSEIVYSPYKIEPKIQQIQILTKNKNKMKKFTLLLVALLFAGAQMLQAQRTITGTVISADDNQSIPGVQVVVKGTTIGTTTNINGQYTLNVPSDATTLVFSFLGLQTQEMEIGGRTTVDVVMSSGAIGLDEFVVLGFGSARRVGNTVGSVQQVGSAQLEARPVANVMDALQGQVAGLQVFVGSGEPGSSPSIRLHGVGSIGGASNTPLFIVDGIPVESGAVHAMNPNDFESVTTLRDASATSIFGARAANGVIVITTKRGLRNEDARITVRSQFGISQLAEKRFFNNMMSSYELLEFREGLIGTQGSSGITQATRDAWEQYGFHNTNWLDIYMRDNVPTFQTDVSVRGGGGKTTYFISGNHFSQEGTAHGSHYNRYSARMNIDSEAKSWLRVGVNTHLSRDDRRSNPNWGTNVLAGGLSMLQAPWWTPVDSAGNRNDMIPGLNALHPEYLAEKSPSQQRNSQMTGSFFVEISPTENLKLITRAGANARDWTSVSGILPSRLDRATHADRGTQSRLNEQLITMNINNVIEYRFNVDNTHNFTALLGQEGTLYNYQMLSTSTFVITDDRQWHIQFGSPARTTTSSNTANFSFLSYFGRVDYNFNERFFGEVTLRNDASSRFGRDNRSAWFWAAGAMWRMTNEPFIRNIPLITDARFNISYGTQGNAEIGNFAHLGLVGSRQAVANQYDGSVSWMLTSPDNHMLGWESQEKLTIGLHTELANRYNVSVEFYSRWTSNMLMSEPFPYTSGFPSVMGNVGTLNNTGVDVTLGMEFVRTRDFYIGANVAFNYNKMTVTELFDGQDDWKLPNAMVAYIVGYEPMFYLPIFGGVDPNNGRQWWYLPGENSAVNRLDPRYTTQDARDWDALYQNAGVPRFPPINGGFGVNAGWKGFQLNADFAFSLGKWLYCNTSFFTQNPNRFGPQNQDKAVRDYWKNPGDNTRFPDWRQGQTLDFDSQYLSNASFMRLKNLTLSYNVNRATLAKTNVLHGARVFATARNLFTLTNFIGLDPEVDSNLALGTYGNSRQFQFGIELTF